MLTPEIDELVAAAKFQRERLRSLDGDMLPICDSLRAMVASD